MTGQQLKNSILQWAIQGKLVPQIASEGTADDLLKEIRAEKEKLVKEGKLKKKDLEVKPIEDDEIPFEIPEGWRWCRLGEILDVRDGTHDSPKYVSNGYPLVTSKNLSGGRIDFTTALLINEEDYNKINTRSCVDNDDILYAMIGSIGNPVLVKKERDFAIKNMALFKKINNGAEMIFIYYFLQLEQYAMREFASGGVQSFVSLGYLRNYLMPIPPLSEQKRIVAKIEELMPLVEQYGKAQEQLEALNKELPETLKKSVLQEAIMGKLVPQDPKEGTADELLAEIRKEKEKLVKEGKLKKKDLEVKPIEDDEVPFEIPEGWRWCRLGEICSFLSRGKSPSYSEVPNQYPVFAQKCNLKEGGISLEQARFLNPDSLGKWKEEFHLKTDDVLVNSTGTGTVCRTRLYNESYQGNYPFVVPDSHVSVIRTFDTISSPYIYYLLNSKIYQDYWEDRLAGSTNQKELYIGTLCDTIIPLPPLAEQKRIVAKIEEVMGELDKMVEMMG